MWWIALLMLMIPEVSYVPDTLFVRSLSLREYYEKHIFPSQQAIKRDFPVFAEFGHRHEKYYWINLIVVDESKKPVDAPVFLTSEAETLMIDAPEGKLRLGMNRNFLERYTCSVDSPYFLLIPPPWIFTTETGKRRIDIEDPESVPVKRIYIDDKYNILSSPPVEVYYLEDKAEVLAKELLGTLVKAEKRIRGFIDKTGEAEWGGVLIPSPPELVSITVIPPKGKRGIFPIIYEEVEGTGELKLEPREIWSLIHKRTEASIAGFYLDVPEMRWIGDGIAEYVAYKISGELAPGDRTYKLSGYPWSIKKLLEEGKKRYNLPKEFIARVYKVLPGEELEELMESARERRRKKLHVEVAGYPISFYIWYKVTEKAGDGVIKEFLQKMKKIEEPSNEEYMDLLSELTGMDIKDMVTNACLVEIEKFLKAKILQ